MIDVISKAREQGVDFEQLGLEEIYGRFDFTRDQEMNLSSEWFWHCQLGKYCVYEYPTTEFTTSLGLYLGGRIEEIRESQDGPVRILEVAAGQGLLGLCVAKELVENGADFELVAVDDESWSSSRRGATASNKVDYVKAISQYQPNIIIGAWIPSADEKTYRAVDWSPVFRSCAATEEYILIGSVGEIGGHASPETWGIRYDFITGRAELSENPGYIQDGFQRTDFEHMRDLQLCYQSNDMDMHPSLTVSFRR